MKSSLSNYLNYLSSPARTNVSCQHQVLSRNDLQLLNQTVTGLCHSPGGKRAGVLQAVAILQVDVKNIPELQTF